MTTCQCVCIITEENKRNSCLTEISSFTHSSASEEPPGILKLEDEDGTCDEGEIISGSASEEPPGILKLEDADGTCDEEGNRSSPAPEEPLGILQLIDQLENIVDTLLPG